MIITILRVGELLLQNAVQVNVPSDTRNSSSADACLKDCSYPLDHGRNHFWNV